MCSISMYDKTRQLGIIHLNPWPSYFYLITAFLENKMYGMNTVHTDFSGNMILFLLSMHVFRACKNILINNTEKCPESSILETCQVQF